MLDHNQSYLAELAVAQPSAIIKLSHADQGLTWRPEMIRAYFGWRRIGGLGGVIYLAVKKIRIIPHLKQNK